MITLGITVTIRDAHFLEENQETGNQGPGNFLQEMGDQENQEKNQVFLAKTSFNLEIFWIIFTNFLQIFVNIGNL